MLNPVLFPAPGLSAATADDLFTFGSGLSSSRYRRWVERHRHVAAARQHSATVVPRTAPIRHRRWIRLPSPASGTLSRLP